MTPVRSKITFYAYNLVIIVILLLAGLWAGRWQESSTGKTLKDEMLQQAVDIAATINPTMAEQLTFTAEDIHLPAYDQIRDQMVAVSKIFPYKGIYSMKLIDGQFRFGPESYPYNEPTSSLPGTVYQNPSKEDFETYQNGIPQVFGPITDEYGSFISAMAPVNNPVTGKVIMLIGIDFPTEEYLLALKKAKRIPHIIFLIILLLFLALMLNDLLRRNRTGYHTANKYRNTETAIVGLSFLLLAFVVTVRTISDEKNTIGQNFHSHALMKNNAVLNELTNIHTNLEILGRFITDQEKLLRDEFENFGNYLLGLTTAEAYAWIPKLPAGQREPSDHDHPSDYKMENGNPAFNQQKSGVPASQELHYFPVHFMTRNKKFPFPEAFDISTIPEFSALIRSSEKSGMIGSVKYVIENEGTSEQYIISLNPVYHDPDQSMVHGKNAKTGSLIGFCAVTVNLNHTLHAVLTRQKTDINMLIAEFYDLMAHDTISRIAAFPPVYATMGSKPLLTGINKSRVFQKVTPVFVFGNAFAIVTSASDEFHAAHPFLNSWITGISGFIISIVFAAVAWFWRNQQNLLDNTVKTKTLELTARIKELNCLQQVSKDLQQDYSKSDLCKRTTEHLSASMQFPEHTSVMITMGNEKYFNGKTAVKRINEITSDIQVFGENKGKISISYDHAIPFVQEENYLINQVALLLGKHFEQAETEQMRKIAIESLEDSDYSLKFAQKIAKMGSWEYHPEQKEVKWSENNYRILGFEPYEVQLTPEFFKNMVHPDDRHFFENPEQNIPKSDTPVNFEVRFIKKDGSLIWLETFTVGVYENDKLIAYRGVNIDITDRKTASNKLLESEEKFRLIAENTADSIMLMDLLLNITYVSPSVQAIRGFTPEEVLQQPADKIFTPDSLARLKNTLKEITGADAGKVSGLKQSVKLEVEVYCKDTSTIWMEMNLSCIRNDLNQPIGLVSVSRDITLRKKTEDALREAKEKAEASDRLKSAFMNNISHEIRTPLNEIMGFGQMIMQEEIGEDEKQDYLNILQTSTERLIDTITDFMDISLIASENLKVNPSDFELLPFINELFLKLKNWSELKNITSEMDFPGSANNIFIRTDQELLRKSVLHLIRNAVKFTHKGKIILGVHQHESEIEIYVKDTGIGVAKEALQRIFDNFGQEEMTSTRTYEGSGLGLSITKGIMQLLGGRIDMESEKGKGSVFSLYLSYQPIKKPEMITVQTSTNEVSPPEKPLILLAEDDDSNAFFIKVILKKASCEVIHVTNGEDAVEQCKASPAINLVIMDIKMPKMNGLEATRLIKAMKPDLPVIAVTAYALTGDEHRILAAGCDDYLSKPYNKESILEKVRKFIKIA